jgi:asparagine synthase (glutamine-hydrolysing)
MVTRRSIEVEPRRIERMNERLVHRGPDDAGSHCGPHVGLGQRRLAIIDLNSRGTAPLSNETRDVWVTFNGEIYNFQSLRQRLQRAGHTFRTETDTEVLVHLYEEHGDDCVEHLRGMFAFAIWDGRRRRLFAARDRLGQKPFYYTDTGEHLLFASEIKALLPEPEVDRAPDYEALDAYLTHQYVPAPRTAFGSIQKLPPGHTLSWGVDEPLERRRYWQPEFGASRERRAPRDVLEDDIRERFREAVRLRMISDVPIGALLSGGIDSGATVAMMARESDGPVETFSIGLKGAESDELPYARQVAERYDTDHHEFEVEPDPNLLPWLVRHYDEPFADSSAIPTYYVSKMARRHVTVALAGDGGDENFAGYPVYDLMRRWSALDVLPLRTRRLLFGTLERLSRHLPHDVEYFDRIGKGLTMLASSPPDRARFYRSFFKPREKRAGYTNAFRARIASEPMACELDVPWRDDMSIIDWMMRHDQAHYLAQCLNTKVDMASMAHSLEVRAPFQDHRFIEFTSTIPASTKWPRGGRNKSLLRDAFRPLLPKDVVDKPKTGFTIPIGSWFRDELSDLVRGMLQDDRGRSRGLFRPSFLDRLVDDHLSGERDWTNRIWALVCLELWFREYID